MAKKARVRDYDQFIVRLPPGMRERIKAKADRAGMSMNEAIVWCLENYFPAPETLDDRLSDLANLLSMLKDSKDPYGPVEALISEIEDTVDKIASDKIPTDHRFSKMVHDRLTYWRELQLDNWRDTHESPFDDENWPSGVSSGGEDPFPNPPEPDDDN